MTEKSKDPLAGKSRAFRLALEAVEEMGRMAEAKIKGQTPGPETARGTARETARETAGSEDSGAEARKDTTPERAGPERAGPDPATCMLAFP